MSALANDMIHYSFGDIAAASGDITATTGRINGLLNDLKSTIQPMTATWKGDSAAAYNAAQKQWDNALVELNEVLASIARAVAAGNDAMSDINRSAAASWS